MIVCRCVQVCREQSSRLEYLASVMLSYSKSTFAKDCFQWTKCVVKYLYDVYSSLSDIMIAFLVEVSVIAFLVDVSFIAFLFDVSSILPC